MRVLIVQSNKELGRIWERHLARLGADVMLASAESTALDLLADHTFDVIVVDLVLTEGSAFTVVDVAQYRLPHSNIVFVTDTTFFSDGSIFAHCANLRAFVETTTPPADLAEIVVHYGQSASRARAGQDSPAQG